MSQIARLIRMSIDITSVTSDQDPVSDCPYSLLSPSPALETNPMSSPRQVTLGIRGREFAEFESLVTTPQLTAYGPADLKARSHRALERPHVRIHFSPF